MLFYFYFTTNFQKVISSLMIIDMSATQVCCGLLFADQFVGSNRAGP
jgi:hypothetical protein